MAVIYQKYRPAAFKDVTGQDHVVTTIQNQFGSGSLAHAYLFTGPRGVGKTTMARLLAKIVNCQTPKGVEACQTCSACVQVASGQALDVYEIDAASHTDVENVRENIIKSVRFAPNSLKKKVYIIDEVHMLSTSSFNALLKTLEEPPEHALFILATTEIHKVPETIISRCQRFDFKRIPQKKIVDRLNMIIKSEGVSVEETVLEQIAKHSGGSARDAESMLGQVLALGDKEITAKQASLVLPATNSVIIEEFVGLLLSQNASESITKLNEYLEQGVDLVQFVDDVISWLRDKLLEVLPLTKEELEGVAVDITLLRKAIETFLESRQSARGDFIPQLPIELAIIEICGEKGRGTRDEGRGMGVSKEEIDVVPSPRQENDKVIKEEKKDFKEQGVASVHVQEGRGVMGEGPGTRDGEREDVQPIAVEETVFDTVPVLNIEEVKAKWPEVFQQIQECNTSLPLFMSACEICEVTNDRVELAFEYDLHVQAVNKQKNRELIETVLKRVLGHDVKVRAIKSKKKSDAVVVDLAKQFGGNVV